MVISPENYSLISLSDTSEYFSSERTGGRGGRGGGTLGVGGAVENSLDMG